jgi:hypothetical protein
LNNVRWIDSALQSPVNAQRDHPPQAFAMRFQRLAQSLGITRRRSPQQLGRRQVI